MIPCPILLPQMTLGTKTVHIWQIDLGIDTAAQAVLYRLLSDQEANQAGHFHFERDTRRFVAAHSSLRMILGRYLAITPEQVKYARTEHGKPYLAEYAGLHFNLSHSHELALVAVTLVGAIGVDVEHQRPLDDLDRMAGQCFSERESEQYQALPATARPRAFFDAWTRKEAYIKALGGGLSHSLQAFTVCLLPDLPAELLEVNGSAEEVEKWTLQMVETQPGYSAAFAVRARGVTCEPFVFELDREVAHVIG